MYKFSCVEICTCSGEASLYVSNLCSHATEGSGTQSYRVEAT